jgi:hypothetical protein
MEPVTVAEANMVSSNVPETDHAAWSSATTYALADRVIRNHRVYESVQAGNTNHDPLTDATSTWWLNVSATNRWKAFDGGLSDPATQAGDIVYTLSFSKTADCVAIFGLDAAEVQLKVTDPVEGVIHDQTYPLISSEEVHDGWTYCFAPFTFSTDLMVRSLPIYSGCDLEVTVSSTGTTKVGEILIGDDHYIGKTLVDTAIGLQDYSVKERDAWGAMQIVERGFTRTVDYRFAFDTTDARRIQRIMSRIRARVAVFSGGDGADQYGVTIPGFYKDFSVPLTTNVSFGSLEVESLI